MSDEIGGLFVIIILVIIVICALIVVLAAINLCLISGAIFGSVMAVRNYVISFKENVIDANRKSIA